VLYDELYNIVIGFMEAQVNLVDGSRWSPEDPFIKYCSPTLTVVSDSVVEKVRTQAQPLLSGFIPAVCRCTHQVFKSGFNQN
jgi:hypothetical protein